MENLKKERSVIRRLYTKTANDLEAAIRKNLLDPDPEMLHAKLKELSTTLFGLDRQIKDLLVVDCEEDELEKELLSQYEYKTKWLRMDAQYKKHNSSFETEDRKRQERSFKLPKLELQIFDGELKNWISFWSQFSKIHTDMSLDPTEKYQYLLQSMKIDSEPRLLVEGFPATAYEKCIEQLMGRYAREDLLIQIYIRELLALVLLDKKENLRKLYDQLTAHLRALETLKVTTDKYAAFLLPMVESALPSEVLKLWERNRNKVDDVAEELNNLLEFLHKEVESEQRLEISRNTFNSSKVDTNDSAKPTTAECLVSSIKNKSDAKWKCVWCDKENHASIECYKLQKLTLEEKKALLKQKKACSICLRKGHHPKICKANVKCLLCERRHSTVLCPGKQEQKDQTDQKEDKKALALASTAQKGETLLQTLVVEIETGGKKQKIRALLDSGSQRSYVKKEIIEKMKIPPADKEVLTHILFGGVETKSKEFSVYKFNVCSLSNSYKLEISAICQNNICGHIPQVNLDDTQLKNLLNVNHIALTDTDVVNNEIGLFLLGADFLGYLLTGSVVQLKDGLVAVNTKLGWTLQGRQVSVNLNNCINILHCACESDLTDYWKLETLGIHDPVEVKSKSETEAEVIMSFEENVQVNSAGRYEVQLPWKIGCDQLQNNFNIAKQRLISTTEKLLSSHKFDTYHGIIQEWQEQGVIESVAEPETNFDHSHYLPHRAVIKDSSLTTKIRPVFDASARDKNGKSLNLCLEKGINFLEKIPTLLVAFRKGAIGVSADIAKAFLQISLSPKDRDYLRFLWWSDASRTNIVTFRHCRVVFGLTSSPFLLSATLQHHLEKEMKINHQADQGPAAGQRRETAQLLSKSFYVDNCITSLDTEREVNNFILHSKQIMQNAKFDLRQWVTAPMKLNETGQSPVSVLGIVWDTDSDELYCNTNSLPQSNKGVQQVTKREVLSLSQKIFDPIGFTSPAMLSPKLILKEAWRRDISWDEPLPSDLQDKFFDWYKWISYLNFCRIPRRLSSNSLRESQVSLHLFCDASKDGYGACVLLRAENPDKVVTLQLVTAKSRVSPPKQMTIPRLELLATLIGSRLLRQARLHLEITPCKEYCWTDSSVALCWIKRELPWNTFVGNRVKEIRQNTQTGNWNHISGENNWADLASRGCNARVLKECNWAAGPAWLKLPADQWPKSELTVDEDQVHLEMKKTVCNNNIINKESSVLNKLHKYFSKYSKLVRTVAWVLRFKYNTQNKIHKKGELSYKEFEKAEKSIIKIIQQEQSELIENNTKNLTKFIDKDNIVRIKTKLMLSDYPEYMKTPYLLIAKHPVVEIMVRQRHVQLQHAGANQLISDLRSRFWIVGIRRLVRSVITKCIICTKYRAKPTRAPTAPLPLERVTCSAPFQTAGVDLAGPLFLKNGDKCWIVLYTCAVYRAVHLEVTRSLSTEAFLMTLRRFIARRGRIDMLSSDQGTNFHGTKNLFDSLDWNEIQRHATIRRITWKMNAPSAAWWGGYWERLIRIMKDLLRRLLGKALLSYDELQTVICDCEAIMNGRPLTFINDDKAGYLEPLTPIHFIQPIPTSDVRDLDEIDSKNLNSRVRYLQTLRNQFRDRFKSDYLAFLVQKGNEEKDNIKVRDIVLIETEEKRVKWPLGLVEELYPGKDGIERTAKVKTAAGVKIRPVQRLYKLELSGNDLSLDNMLNIPLETSEGNKKLPRKNTDIREEEIKTPPIRRDNEEQFSRRGRKVRIPSRFDLYHL